LLADTRKKLAVKLADTWLLFDNSQLCCKPMITNRKPGADFQQIDQEKNSWLLY